MIGLAGYFSKGFLTLAPEIFVATGTTGCKFPPETVQLRFIQPLKAQLNT
jgi:hypothetical protein